MRHSRLTWPGAFHHVMNRGHGGEKVFKTDFLKRNYLEILETASRIFRIPAYAYCVLGNHFHLVVRNANGQLSRFMKAVHSRYGILSLKHLISLVFMAFFLCTGIMAQTLDEALHPLLKKGQGDLSMGFKNYGYEHFSIDVFQGEMTCYDSRVILFPSLTFGLARNLQLSVSGAYQFPIEFSAPQFEEWDYWRETNTIESLSAQLSFRPASNMELRLLLLRGRAKADTHYPYTLGVDSHDVENFAGNILIFGGTWLSAVDIESRPLRADLDGLHGPLLKKGRWRLEPEILVRGHECEYRHRYDVLPDYLDENTTSTDTRLRLAASHGLTGHVQVKVDAYWQPLFRIRESHRSSITWLDKTEHFSESEASRLYFDYWGGRGGLLWRPNPQMELSLACSRNELKTGYERDETTVIPRIWYTHIISQIDLGATWLSRPKLAGISLIADLPGIHHPLLEKKQFKLAGRIYFRSYRMPNALYGDFLKGLNDSDFWLFRLHGAYGFFHSLQVSLYYGVSLSKRLFTGFKYEKDYSLGGELKWRLKKRAEVRAALNYRPMVFLDMYPPFMLGIHEGFFGNIYHDFLSPDFGESVNVELGCRLFF